jgi:aminoglycoside phosphotransferase
MSTWELVKARTAAVDGAVWRCDTGEAGVLYRRTGDATVATEARRLIELAALGYPVPDVLDSGRDGDGDYYYTERSVGPASLHDLALADADEHGHLGERLTAAALAVSARLLRAQAATPLPGGPDALREWFVRAAFVDNVFAENPDLDTPRVHATVETALDRLAGVPMCHGHLDYGLPNAFPGGVIDWQHAGPAPLGYDVYPMLEIVPFKGGNRGYAFTSLQREDYLARLGPAAGITEPLRERLGEWLLVKCFFFLALMRPTPDSRPGKALKWRYRRTLFQVGLEQYESSGAIDTGAFPTLAAFTERYAHAGRA